MGELYTILPYILLSGTLTLIIIYQGLRYRKSKSQLLALLETEKEERIRMEELLQTIQNEMAELQKNSQQEESENLPMAANTNDQRFLEHISTILEKNLDNPDFIIDEFARELGLSRTVFYSKFKSLTGMTPNDYVMNYKMKRATHLLQNHPELQITDITYQLGFCSPRYFSRCFKMQFNITPTEYRKQLNGQENA